MGTPVVGVSPSALALPDIDWQKVYEKLGMQEAYERGIARITVDAGEKMWSVPVLGIVPHESWVALIRGLNLIPLCFTENPNEEILSHLEARDPRNGPYSVAVSRDLLPDKRTLGRNAEQLDRSCHCGMTMNEWKLLWTGVHAATGLFIDTGYRTMQTGTRFGAGLVGYGYSDVRNGTVGLFTQSSTEVGETTGSRGVIALAPPPPTA